MLSASRRAAQRPGIPPPTWYPSRRPAMAEGKCPGDQTSLGSLFILVCWRERHQHSQAPLKEMERWPRGLLEHRQRDFAVGTRRLPTVLTTVGTKEATVGRKVLCCRCRKGRSQNPRTHNRVVKVPSLWPKEHRLLQQTESKTEVQSQRDHVSGYLELVSLFSTFGGDEG